MRGRGASGPSGKGLARRTLVQSGLHFWMHCMSCGTVRRQGRFGLEAAPTPSSAWSMMLMEQGF